MAADDKPKPTTPPVTTTTTQQTADPKAAVELVKVQEQGKNHPGPKT